MDNVNITFFRAFIKIKKGAYAYIRMNNQKNTALPYFK